jgi:hypothetical protein
VDDLRVMEIADDVGVRFVPAFAPQDDGRRVLLGVLWLSLDDEAVGFVVHPQAIWSGGEIARSIQGALRRGWTPGRIYAYWRTDPVCLGSTEREVASLGILRSAISELA